MRKLFPKMKFNKVEDINLNFVKDNHIQGFIMDIDNTLVKWKSEPDKTVLEWLKLMKDNGIKLCLLSNNHKKRVKYIGEKLGIDVLYSAKKPFKKGFLRAIEFLNLKPENIAMIGDQIFTDIWGGNMVGLYTIFITPRSQDEHIITKVKRPLEKFVLKKYTKMEVTKK